ncbi:MAG: Slam-dependent surface lipoprotein [Pasteurellaceae bacterium]|nr:Slam-dependent surface lipoprotein [Pasteurellaceae bacterium]
MAKLNHLEFSSFFSKDNKWSYNLVRGELTSEKQMPQSGVVNYQGQVFYGTEHSRDLIKGISSFAVDFGQKTVSGRFNVAGKQIDLAVATISENTFRHHSHQREEKTQEFMRGYFFGKNAAELGGVWEREKDDTAESAVFGATKQ